MYSEQIKNQLMESYPYRIELHAHTSPASGCSEISPREMVDTYKAKGYHAVVITNHFTTSILAKGNKEDSINEYLEDYYNTVEQASKCDLKILLGTEIRFSENNNDYLIYGVNRDILSLCYDYLSKGIECFRTEVSLENSVFIQAHPFRNGIERCNPDLLDGIEVFNMHPNHNGRNGLSVRYAYHNNIAVKTAGSDFHHPNLGHEAVSALRCRELPQDSFELADILKKGDYVFEIGENSIVLP